MRMPYAILVAVLGLFLLALPVRADEVLLHDGRTMEGTVSDVTSDGLSLEMHPKGGGTASIHVPAEHLDPHYFYQLRDQGLGKDTKGRLELAVWAYEHGLFRRAKAQFDKARTLDAELAKQFLGRILPGLKEGIAEQMVDAAKLDMAGGRLADAKKILSKVLTKLADTHAASDARALVPTLQKKISQNEVAQQGRKKFADDSAAMENAAEQKRLLGPPRDLIRHGRHLETRAMTAEHETPALADYKQAAVEFDKARRHLDELAKHHSGNADLMQQVSDMQETVKQGLIQAYESAANIYMTRGDYRAANEMIDKLKAAYPDAPEVAQLQGDMDDQQSEPDWSWEAWRRGPHRRGPHGGMRRGGRGGGRRR